MKNNEERKSAIRIIGIEGENQNENAIKNSENKINTSSIINAGESFRKNLETQNENVMMSFVDLNVKNLLGNYLIDYKNDNSSDEELKNKIETVQNTIIASEGNFINLKNENEENVIENNKIKNQRNSVINFAKRKNQNKNQKSYSLIKENMNMTNISNFHKDNNRLSVDYYGNGIKSMINNLKSLNENPIQKKKSNKLSILSLNKNELKTEIKRNKSINAGQSSKKELIDSPKNNNHLNNNITNFHNIRPNNIIHNNNENRRRTINYTESRNLKSFQKNISPIIPDDENKDLTDIRNIFKMDEKKLKELSSIVVQIKQTLLFKPDNNQKMDNNNILGLPSSMDEKNNQKEIKEKMLEEGINENYLSEKEIFEEKKNQITQKEIQYRHLLKMSLVYDSLTDEEDGVKHEKTYNDEQGIFIRPDSIFKIYYDGFSLLFVLFSMFFIPLILAFPEYNENKVKLILLFIFDVIIDCFYFSDIIITCLTAVYYIIEEQLITEFSVILKKYIQGFFFLDLITAIPFNSILDFYDFKNVGKYINFPSYFRGIYLLRLIRLLKSFKVFLNNSFIENMINYLNMKVGSLDVDKYYRLFLSLFSTIYSFHLFGCIFIFIGKNNYPNWITYQGIDIQDNKDIYIASIYFVCATIFSVGYGDVVSKNHPERFFNVIMLTIGMLIYSWMVSALSNSFIDNSDSAIEYKKNLEVLIDIKGTYDNLPDNLYKKIRRYLIYKRNNDTINYNTIYDNLPIMLRNQLILEMYKPIIETFVFFKNFDNPDFILKVILRLKPFNGIRGERLVNDGDFIEEIIFVKRGTLVVEFPIPIVLKQYKGRRKSLLMSGSKKSNAHILNSIMQNGNLERRRMSSLNNLNTYTINNNLGKRVSSYIPNDLESRILNRRKSLLPQNLNKLQTYVKLLEIGKSEHFGDIIMFLNQRSPLSLRVKSRKAELLFLMKTDAIEISVGFPKIWRQILKNSLFNMQQIDNLINKYLKLFFINQQKPKKGIIDLFSQKASFMEESNNGNIEVKNNVNIKKKSSYFGNLNNQKTIMSMSSIASIEEKSENSNESSNFNNDSSETKNLEEFNSDESKKNNSIDSVKNVLIDSVGSNNSHFISEEFKNNENELKNDFLFKRGIKSNFMGFKGKNKFKDLEVCKNNSFSIRDIIIKNTTYNSLSNNNSGKKKDVKNFKKISQSTISSRGVYKSFSTHSLKKKKKSKLKTIKDNMKENEINLNNPQKFYTNIFSKMMIKDQKDSLLKKISNDSDY